MTDLEEARAQRNASNRRIEELSRELYELQAKFDAAQRVIQRHEMDSQRVSDRLWGLTGGSEVALAESPPRCVWLPLTPELLEGFRKQGPGPLWLVVADPLHVQVGGYNRTEYAEWFYTPDGEYTAKSITHVMRMVVPAAPQEESSELESKI